ncbi:putative thioredoxin [Pectobacterium phage DU_PP_V]|uniref:Putative thioredoxin n=1 Tax=Pectobacterium phage DU_PP_V TaxID=2041492 RepID=A0A2D2W749_9CAUD|nr:putative thioredoxin [Pectobacterium phage DU_PP_V]ATS94010.1 putative thioredoxin [Pectobacterium phage DU_PP_V]
MQGKRIALFTSSTCVPCRSFKPVFTDIAITSGLPYAVFEDDTEQMRKCGIRSVPTVVLFENEEAHHILTGSYLKSSLLENAIRDFKEYTDETFYAEDL